MSKWRQRKEGNGRPITDAHSWVNHVTGWQHDAHFHCPVSPCGFFQTLTLCCPLSYRLIFLLPRFPGAQFPSPIFCAFFSNALFNVAVTSVAHFSGWHYFHCPFSVAVISDIYFFVAPFPTLSFFVAKFYDCPIFRCLLSIAIFPCIVIQGYKACSILPTLFIILASLPCSSSMNP